MLYSCIHMVAVVIKGLLLLNANVVSFGLPKCQIMRQYGARVTVTQFSPVYYATSIVHESQTVHIVSYWYVW